MRTVNFADSSHYDPSRKENGFPRFGRRLAFALYDDRHSRATNVDAQRTIDFQFR